MKKMISLTLALGLLMSGNVFAEDHGVTNGDRTVGVVGAAAWGTATSLVSGGLQGSWAEYSAMAVLAFGIIAGSIISYTTDPEREGRGYRWNGQVSSDEERKFEDNPNVNGRWKRLKAYTTRGTGIQEAVLVSPIPENKRWTHIGDTGF